MYVKLNSRLKDNPLPVAPSLAVTQLQLGYVHVYDPRLLCVTFPDQMASNCCIHKHFNAATANIGREGVIETQL